MLIMTVSEGSRRLGVAPAVLLLDLLTVSCVRHEPRPMSRRSWSGRFSKLSLSLTVVLAAIFLEESVG